MGSYYSDNDSRNSASSQSSRPNRSMARGCLSVFSILIVIGFLAGGFYFLNNSPIFATQSPTEWSLPTLGGSNPNGPASTATESTIPCEILIQKAIEASGQACNNTDSNTACYGNKTIVAELVPDANVAFSNLGDIINIDQLLNLAAAPLDVEKQEWGVVIMKLLANLPNSLPGETITMVVFGNTSFSKDAGALQAFYFASTPGGITCEQAPAEGIVIDVPDGSGITFTINGSELSLTGDASIQAVQGTQMQVSLFNGTGTITSNGETKAFGAGQQVSVQLGGDNGVTSISVPSDPVPLSTADLALSCALTGQNCGVSNIPTLSADAIQSTLQAAFGTSTPTRKPGSATSVAPGGTPAPSPATRVPPGLAKKTATPQPPPQPTKTPKN